MAEKKEATAKAEPKIVTPKDDALEGANVNGDLGAAEVQAKMDQETEQGFRGVKVDPTPNENYTVSGVTSGAPTPETDADAAAEADAQVRRLGTDDPHGKFTKSK